MEQARKLVELAAAAEADAVKFQKFTAKELCVKRHSRYEHFRKLELKSQHVKELCTLAHDRGIHFYCDAFGVESIEQLLALPVDGIKIHSSDISNFHLLRCLSGWQGVLLLSCGGTFEIEIYRALEQLNPAQQALILLHGFQSFPTPLEESNLRRIRFLRETFRLPVGFMDHIDAEDQLAYTLPLMAMGAGAVLLEKHITLDRSLKGIDYYSSLNPNEMQRFVGMVRRTEEALGRRENVFGPQERNYRTTMKKQLIAARPIKEGAILSEAEVTYKRTEDDCYSLNIRCVLDKKARVDIAEEETLRLDHFELRVGILIIARMNSSRLPGKAIMPILERPTLSYLIERAQLARSAVAVVLCTTTRSDDDVLANLAASAGIRCCRGNEIDVLGRILKACRQERLDVAVRVTGDDILLSPEHLDQAVSHLLVTNADYCHNKALPSGTECEVFTVEALQAIHDFAMVPENTEYLTYFIESENFQKTELEVPKKYRRRVNLSMDARDDFERIKYILENIYDPQIPYTMDDLIGFIDQHPDRFKASGPPKRYIEVRNAINCDLDFRRAG
jgi:N,N'-diacetyllegionaminate synthase